MYSLVLLLSYRIFFFYLIFRSLISVTAHCSCREMFDVCCVCLLVRSACCEGAHICKPNNQNWIEFRWRLALSWVIRCSTWFLLFILLRALQYGHLLILDIKSFWIRHENQVRRNPSIPNFSPPFALLSSWKPPHLLSNSNPTPKTCRPARVATLNCCYYWNPTFWNPLPLIRHVFKLFLSHEVILIDPSPCLYFQVQLYTRVYGDENGNRKKKKKSAQSMSLR